MEITFEQTILTSRANFSEALSNNASAAYASLRQEVIDQIALSFNGVTFGSVRFFNDMGQVVARSVFNDNVIILNVILLVN